MHLFYWACRFSFCLIPVSAFPVYPVFLIPVSMTPLLTVSLSVISPLWTAQSWTQSQIKFKSQFSPCS